jgi:tellurite resistance protein
VLARLTLSANRFWQMIGRGTRGEKVGGTKFCYVVDPIKLTRLYDYFKGYQPSFDGRQQEELEEREAGDDDQGLEPPGGSVAVPGGALPPDPQDASYVVDERLERVNVLAARAIEQFLRGLPLTETDALAVACNTKLAVRHGQVVFVPSAAEFDPIAAAALLVGGVSGLEVRHGVSLPWLRGMLVEPATADDLVRWLRLLRTVESQRCWTRPQFDAAGLRMTVVHQAEVPTAQSQTPAASAQAEPADDGGEAFLVDAGAAMAVADGKMTEPEVKAIAQGLFEFFGRPSTPELLDRIRAHRASADIASRVPARMPPAEGVFRMLEGVAAADGIVCAEEMDLLRRLAKAMGLPESFVKVELGPVVATGATQTTRPVTAIPAGRVCWNCSFVVPATHAFCTNCGRSLDPAMASPVQSSTSSSSRDDAPFCREVTCTYRAQPGNYGFCGRHRAPERRVVRGSDRCKATMQDGRRCPASSLPGNYGFCGRHR